MNEIDILNVKIADTEKYLDELKKRRNRIIAENTEKEAYKNGFEAHFDGLKYIADRDNPIPLTLPMYVRANMIYSYGGINYVCVQSGMVTEDTFDDMLEPDEIELDEKEDYYEN